jgi:hypothetical protein
LIAAAFIAWLLAPPFAAADERPPDERPIVALDVGHSLKRPGATSTRRLPEFAFDQALAARTDTSQAIQALLSSTTYTASSRSTPHEPFRQSKVLLFSALIDG